MKINTHNPRPLNFYRLYRFSSIIIGNSWKRIPSISDLLPGLAAYIACVSGRICNLLLSLMCSLAVCVEALLYVILKAHAIFINSAISYPFSSSSKNLTVHLIDVQVAL